MKMQVDIVMRTMKKISLCDHNNGRMRGKDGVVWVLRKGVSEGVTIIWAL